MRVRVLFIILIFIVVSCSEKTQFTQLKKDWDALLDEKIGSADSTETADYSTEVVSQRDSAQADQNEPKTTTSFNSGNNRQDLVNFAKQYIGTKYSFACATPEEGFDCSGFLYYVFNKYGYDVPRSSAEYEFFGKEIPVQQARRGDLVLFTPTENDTTGARIGHIGILINEKGMNSEFIHSSSGKANGVTISELGSDHYTKRFVKAINIMD